MNNLTHSHRRAWETIPWIVNGSASAEDIRATHEHLRQCADCRKTLAFEQTLHAALAQPQANPGDAAQGWQRLSAQLKDKPMAGGHSNISESEQARAPASGLVRWLAAAVIVEALALGAVVSSSWINRLERTPVDAYRTLSQPDPVVRNAPTFRVVLSGDMTLEQLHDLLNSAHLQVVAGPSEAGVWSLAPADNAATVANEGALKRLRGSSQVRFAEPINSQAGAPAH
jgi:hypothetical protein